MVTYDHQEESSSEETQINHHNDRSGVVIRRSYECFYCKRGFDTAQALGGHMNIHRKDRANKSKKPSTSNEPKESKIYRENPNLPLERTNLPISGSYNDEDQYLQLGLMNYGANYTTLSDEYSCGNIQLQLFNRDHRKDSYYEYHHHRQPFNHSMIEACDWMMRSSSEYYSPVIVEEDSEMNKQVIVDYHDEDLDLELRLGYV